MPDTHDRYLSPLQGALCGIGAMLASAHPALHTLLHQQPCSEYPLNSSCESLAGALAVGAAHFRFTGKQLVAEGIDLKSRARAFPVAVRPA